jgi:phosphoribosylglycinamide formyltransferase 1
LHKKISIYTDGGSRGNPGPAAAGFLILDESNKRLAAKAFFLGETTNNVAEYTGLLKAILEAKNIDSESIEIFSDSELMVKQLNGEYKVKSNNLSELYEQCMEKLGEFNDWKIKYIPREKNKKADSLVNKSMDAKKNIEEKFHSAKTGKKLKIGILISGGGRTMINIQKNIEDGTLNAEIMVVISSRSDSIGVEKAKAAGLNTQIIRKKDYSDIEQFSSRITQILRKANVDLVVQAGWLCLWKIPDEYNNRVMNIHPALLPSFGGKGLWGHHVHEAVIKKGCKVSGCTVHFCTNEYDEGPIILQRCCPVKDNDTADSLAERVFGEECIAYPEAIRLYSEGKIEIRNGRVEIKE